MTGWVMAWVITLCVIALSGLMVYANHAGRNKERVRESENEKQAANQAAATSQKMAQAEAQKPANKTALLNRLDKGDF